MEVTRKTWGFTGVIESDCGAISGIVSHNNAKDAEGAAIAAVGATVDMECDSAYKSTLVNATAQGKVQRSALEAAVARVLKGRFQIGQFDAPSSHHQEEAQVAAPWDSLDASAVFAPEHQQLSLEAAQQSAVLLRNNPVSSSQQAQQQAHLPLARGQNIAVIGPNGNVADVFQGQYHGSNCPNVSGWNGSYDCLPTAFTEIRRQNGGGNVTYHAGCALSPSASDGSGHPEGQPCASLDAMDTVLAAAQAADVVVLFLGLDIKMTNKEGQDRAHNASGYALPGMQQELARQIAGLRKPTVVVTLSGMATGMDYIASKADWPLLVGGYGGRFGPVALTQILFGDVSPTGRLPYTIYPEAWAANTEMTDMALTAGDGRTYKWYKGEAPLPFAFGSGMTYTTFKTVVAREESTEETPLQFQASVSVSNTGSVAAQQTVMLFMRPVKVPNAPTPAPNRQLFDFGRTRTLAPGEHDTLTFTVTDREVALVDENGSHVAFKGEYAIEFWTGGDNDKHPPPTLPYTVSETTTLSTLPSPPASMSQFHEKR